MTDDEVKSELEIRLGGSSSICLWLFWLVDFLHSNLDLVVLVQTVCLCPFWLVDFLQSDCTVEICRLIWLGEDF